MVSDDKLDTLIAVANAKYDVDTSAALRELKRMRTEKKILAAKLLAMSEAEYIERPVAAGIKMALDVIEEELCC